MTFAHEVWQDEHPLRFEYWRLRMEAPKWLTVRSTLSPRFARILEFGEFVRHYPSIQQRMLVTQQKQNRAARAKQTRHAARNNCGTYVGGDLSR